MNSFRALNIKLHYQDVSFVNGFFLYQKRFEGTKVSVETFMAWKTKFDAEMNELKSRRVKETPEPKGLSGRVIFLICYIDLWCLTPLSTIFQWRSVLLVEENGVLRRKPLTCRKSLTNLIT